MLLSVWRPKCTRIFARHQASPDRTRTVLLFVSLKKRHVHFLLLIFTLHFSIYRKRRILEFTQHHTLTYMERILFEFNPDASESLDTKFETINLPIFVSVLVAKQLLEKFYVGFIGPVIYNSIAMTLRASGEQWIEEITARQLLVARKMPILEFLHRILLPLRSVGIPVPDEFGADGFKLENHSFGLTTTVSSGELGPFEVYAKTEFEHLAGDIVAFKDMRCVCVEDNLVYVSCAE